jgi:hypothetical protein
MVILLIRMIYGFSIQLNDNRLCASLPHLANCTSKPNIHSESILSIKYIIHVRSRDIIKQTPSFKY